LNIFAADIERVFVRHPDVSEAAAIGVPHPKWGEHRCWCHRESWGVNRPGGAADVG